KKNEVLQGAGTLFWYNDDGVERWFVLTVAHVTQGQFFDSFIVDESGKPLYQLVKKSLGAVDHLTDLHIFEVQSPPENIITKDEVPSCQLKILSHGKGLYRLYLQEAVFNPEKQFAVAEQLAIPHLPWVQEKGFEAFSADIYDRNSPYGLRFNWNLKEYNVDSRVIHGMSGLPALTFDRIRLMWVVLGEIKGFHRIRNETYLVSDRAMSSAFEALLYGNPVNPNQEGVAISWRYRSPFGTYRFFKNEKARFAEISSRSVGLSTEKAGGHETGDGGGHETGDGGGISNDQRKSTSERKMNGPEVMDWQWQNDKSAKAVAVLSYPVPLIYRSMVSSKRIWVSASVRSLEFLGFPEMFENEGDLATHHLSYSTLKSAFKDRVQSTLELFSRDQMPFYCRVSLNNEGKVLKIKLQMPKSTDFEFAKNSENFHEITVKLNDLVKNDFNVVSGKLAVNAQGLFLFDPINSYAPSPAKATEQAFDQSLIAYIVLKDHIKNFSNRSLVLPCISDGEKF
ncbi:MAG: hypothetical protein ACXVCY_18530, partial [Pseudobdellovibrionaceae bacterium]